MAAAAASTIDHRTLELQTILRVYLNECLLAVQELERRRKAVVAAHTYYGPTSSIANQNLGKFYFMITQTMHAVDRLDRATQAYVHHLETRSRTAATESSTREQRVRKLLMDHQEQVHLAKQGLSTRINEIEEKVGKANERELLSAIAAKYSDETSYALRLNKGLSLYADYIEHLEEALQLSPGFIRGDEHTPQRLSQIFLGLEQQFEFELEKPCPSCHQTVTISPLSPQLLCPFCGKGL